MQPDHADQDVVWCSAGGFMEVTEHDITSFGLPCILTLTPNFFQHAAQGQQCQIETTQTFPWALTHSSMHVPAQQVSDYLTAEMLNLHCLCYSMNGMAYVCVTLLKCGAGTEEVSGDSSQDNPPRSPSQHPSDEASSSHGGFWQREPQQGPQWDLLKELQKERPYHAQRNVERQQQSATGTWDFDTEPGHTTGHPTDSSSSQGQEHEKQMLYIQMEFCPRTLKKILVAGPIEEADAWQVRPVSCKAFKAFR